MRKFTLIACAALLASAFAGCADNDGTNTTDDKVVQVSLIAGIEPSGAETRTDFSDPAAPKWSEGDAVGIHVSNNSMGMMFITNVRMNGTFSPDYTTATFTGALTGLSTGEYSLTGYYPHGAAGSDTTLETEARIEIPATQYPTAASFDPMADVMVMKPFTYNHDGSSALTQGGLMFKRALSMLKIVLNSPELNGETISNLTFTTDDAELKLAGKAKFDLTEDGGFTGFYADAVTSVTAEPAGDIHADGTDGILLCVPTVTIAANTVMTITGETESFTFTTTKTVEQPIELETGNWHTFNVTTLEVTPKAVEIQAPIYARSTSTWTVGSQVWSDAINVPDCDKTSFYGGTNTNPVPDCRNNGQYGYLYSWRYVRDNGATLCPEGWRVPTKDDFIALDKALGGTGSNQKNPTLREAYENRWALEYGGFANGGSLSYTGSEAYYWSQTPGNGVQYAYRMMVYKSNSNVSPENNTGNTTNGLVVRCVRDI